MLLPIAILVDVIIHPLAVWDVQLLKVNGRFNSAVGLIAACREAEVHIVFFLVVSKKNHTSCPVVYLWYLFPSGKWQVKLENGILLKLHQLMKLFLTDILP